MTPEPYHRRPSDARRGAVVVVTADGELDAAERAFCDALVEQGYEILAAGPHALEAVGAGLTPPVYLLSFAAGGPAAWAAACGAGYAAAALYEPPLDQLAVGGPACPTALHLTEPRTAWPERLVELADGEPDLRLFPYAAPSGFGTGASDAARLARLRTLQLFHRASGAKGEMGGG